MARRQRFFDDDEQEFLAAIAIGATAYRAAEAGEVLATVASIDDGDRESWVETWAATAARVGDVAGATAGASARDAYLRSSLYYGLAAFPALGTGHPARYEELWRASRAAWDRAAELLGAELVAIPYEDTTMPGWLFTPAGEEPHPLAILTNGSDGTNVEAWVLGGAAAVERGYAALLYDGPGQNALLHQRGIGFRPDWEAVVTPIVDWALARTDLDGERLALLGVSQAGYWVPRAAAFEHRIAAAVADPGVMDVSTSWFAHLPDGMRRQLDSGDRAGFNEMMEHGRQSSPQARFQLDFRGMPYREQDAYDLYRAVREYRLDAGTVARIRCPTLVTAPEGEAFWPGQAEQLYEALKAPKDLVRFTAAEGADLHCEPRAPTVRNQRIYDWLDGVLGRGDTAR